MASYFGFDVKIGADGDLSVNSQGDLELATSPESLRQALQFMISTDFREMDTLPSFGANLGTLVGADNVNAVLEAIPTQIRDALFRDGVAENEDVSIHAIPISEDQIYLRIETTGTFFDQDGEVIDTTQIELKFLFPYKTARVIALD